MKKTNVFYIHTHDTGQMIGAYGYPVHTPNLDALAKDSLVFRQAFCVSPTCSPSRAALLTGCYPHENGMLGLAQRGFKLDTKKHLVPLLNRAGYHSVLCGIQHEDGWYLDHESGAKNLGYLSDITTDSTNFRQEDMCEWDRNNAKSLITFLSSYQEEPPLFVSFGMYATHRRYPEVNSTDVDRNYIRPPYPIPDTEQNRKDHAGFLKSLQSVDQNVGDIIQALKETGYYDNSIIIVTTDHGLANPFGKCTLFDSGLAVCLMMRIPDSLSNGKITDSLISHIDVFPTLCDLLHLEKPAWLRGMSFIKEFEAPNTFEREEIFGEINFHTSYEPVRCIRSKRYKYVRYYDKDYLNINISNIDSSAPKEFFLEHQLVHRMKYREALYDLYYDIGERDNVMELPEYKDTLSMLRIRLDHIMKDSHDPLCNGHIVKQPSWKVNKKECKEASSKNPEDYV